METMRLVVQDYLKVIKERGELDAILPDLLREMRFRVIRPAFRGEVQHGVDIAATQKENDKQILFLFVLKAGDINSSNWDTGPNSVRPTLDTIQDAPFEDLTQADLRDAEKKVILVHNGALSDNILARFNGYKSNFRLPFDRWGLDDLTECFSKHLLSERLLPPEYQRYLKRTLAFIDVPDYDLADFKEFVSAILPRNPRSDVQRRRYFGILRLALRMIYYYCQESGNLVPAVAAYEYALLRSWGWMYKNQLFTPKMKREHVVTFAQYLEVTHAVLEKIKPRLVIEDGLALGGTFEMVEYPLRTFRVIGDLGFLATVYFFCMRDSEMAHKVFQEILGLLATTIKNNRSRHRPLLDNHSIDIFLGMWPFLLARQFDFVKCWLEDILEHLTIRKKLGDRLPELYNNIGAVIEYEATNKRPIAYEDSSSTLIYMLFELCLLLDAKDIYDTYRPLSEDVYLQIWYPPENVEGLLYEREVREGDTETAIRLPESFEEFRLDVEARHRRFDKWDYSPLTESLPAMLLLANKHFRTPVFPFWWRILIFGTEETEDSPSGLA
jgi:hypothetical protein